VFPVLIRCGVGCALFERVGYCLDLLLIRAILQLLLEVLEFLSDTVVSFVLVLLGSELGLEVLPARVRHLSPWSSCSLCRGGFLL